MSQPLLEFSGLLGSGLTATSNPNPNTLSIAAPYGANPAHAQDIAAAWSTQAQPALFPNQQADPPTNSSLALAFIPSVGTAGYTITVWKYIGNGQWVSSSNNGSQTYAGPVVDYLANLGRNPWFIQISNLSSGTLSIRYDSVLASAL